MTFSPHRYVSLARLNLAGGEEAPPEIPRVLAVFRDKAQVVVELFECKGDLYTQATKHQPPSSRQRLDA